MSLVTQMLHFLHVGQITSDFPKSCQVQESKIFRFHRRANHRYRFAHPVPLRGALAIVTNVGTGCGGRGSVEHEAELQGGFPVSGSRHADERR
jgi:hypothetical protein